MTTGYASETDRSTQRKVIIAGGSGLIGRGLVQAFSKDEVVVLSRSPGHQAAPPARSIQWDAQHSGRWTEELANADVVINLCGASIGDGRWTNARKREIRDSRIAPARCLIAALARLSHQPVYVQASAIGFYGARGAQVDEASPAGNDYLAQLATEWEAEAETYPGPSIIPRFGLVLAAEGGALPRMILPFKLFAGGKLGSGRQWLSWVTLADAVGAVKFAIDHSMTGPLNVVAPGAVTNSEFSRVAGRILHRPSFLTAPAWVLQAALGEQATLVLEGQRVSPARLLEAGFRFASSDIEGALRSVLAAPKPAG